LALFNYARMSDLLLCTFPQPNLKTSVIQAVIPSQMLVVLSAWSWL